MKSGWKNCDRTCYLLHFAVILIKNEGRHSTGIDVNVPQNQRTTEPDLISPDEQTRRHIYRTDRQNLSMSITITILIHV